MFLVMIECTSRSSELSLSRLRCVRESLYSFFVLRMNVSVGGKGDQGGGADRPGFEGKLETGGGNITSQCGAQHRCGSAAAPLCHAHHHWSSRCRYRNETGMDALVAVVRGRPRGTLHRQWHPYVPAMAITISAKLLATLASL